MSFVKFQFYACGAKILIYNPIFKIENHGISRLMYSNVINVDAHGNYTHSSDSFNDRFICL